MYDSHSDCKLFNNYLFVRYFFILNLKVMDDEEALAIFDRIDDYCLYFYILEFSIKLIGLGVEKYWEDDWNRFDLGMIILSVASNLLYGILTVF